MPTYAGVMYGYYFISGTDCCTTVCTSNKLLHKSTSNSNKLLHTWSYVLRDIWMALRGSGLHQYYTASVTTQFLPLCYRIWMISTVWTLRVLLSPSLWLCRKNSFMTRQHTMQQHTPTVYTTHQVSCNMYQGSLSVKFMSSDLVSHRLAVGRQLGDGLGSGGSSRYRMY